MSWRLLVIAVGTVGGMSKLECDGGEWLPLMVKGIGVKEQSNGGESKGCGVK